MDSVYIFGCLYVISVAVMGCGVLWATSKLASVVAEPLEFMFKWGWDQCTCCGCLAETQHILEVDDFEGSPGRICVACWLGHEKTAVLCMILKSEDCYDRVMDLARSGELTVGMLELEVASAIGASFMYPMEDGD